MSLALTISWQIAHVTDDFLSLTIVLNGISFSTFYEFVIFTFIILKSKLQHSMHVTWAIFDTPFANWSITKQVTNGVQSAMRSRRKWLLKNAKRGVASDMYRINYLNDGAIVANRQPNNSWSTFFISALRSTPLRYRNSVCLSLRPSVRPSVRHMVIYA